MATIHSKPVPNTDESSELKAFDALVHLEDEWHLFHSVAWIGVRGRRIGDGEADFVLVHPQHGALVLEVKGGGIAVDAGRWWSTGKHGTFEIKDPFRQATASKTALHKWLERELGLKVPTAHCVLFSDFSDVGALGPHAPPAITITPRDFDSINQKLDEVVATWGLSADLRPKDMRTISGALAPKTSARRTLADQAFDAHRTIVELTLEQVRAFAGLRRNRRAVVFGGAGTGKTVLALEKAAEFEAQGGEVLLVCYNRLLSLKMREDPRLVSTTTTTFHALCMEALRAAGMELPNHPDKDWWERQAADRLIDALAMTGRKFDAIVVDEGQDFSEHWIAALEIAGAHGPETPFYIFADENQTLWSRDWQPADGWPVFELSINCRNTDQIAERLESIVPATGRPRGAQGPDPKWTDLPKSSRPSTSATRIVDRLLGEGFAPSEICVLCESSTTARELIDMSVGTEGFASYGGAGIVVETIARFKGLEAPAVVVVLESDGARPDVDGYVGFSRASTYLHVIGPSARKSALKWS